MLPANFVLQRAPTIVLNPSSTQQCSSGERGSTPVLAQRIPRVRDFLFTTHCHKTHPEASDPCTLRMCDFPAQESPRCVGERGGRCRTNPGA